MRVLTPARTSRACPTRTGCSPRSRTTSWSARASRTPGTPTAGRFCASAAAHDGRPPGRAAPRGKAPRLRTAGLPHQLVTRAGHDPADALPVLNRLTDARRADLRDTLGARWIPVDRQAEYQARVIRAVCAPAVRRTPGASRSGEPGWGPGPAVPMHRE